MKLTPVFNFISILRAYFVPKNYKAKLGAEKNLCKTILFEKDAHKILVKLTVSSEIHLRQYRTLRHNPRQKFLIKDR